MHMTKSLIKVIYYTYKKYKIYCCVQGIVFQCRIHILGLALKNKSRKWIHNFIRVYFRKL